MISLIKKRYLIKLLNILLICLYIGLFFLAWRILHPAFASIPKPLPLCDDMDISQWKSESSAADKIISTKKTHSIEFTVNNPQTNMIFNCTIKNSITLNELYQAKKITFVTKVNQNSQLRFTIHHENGTGTGWTAIPLNHSVKRLSYDLNDTGDYKITWLNGTFTNAVFYIDNISDSSKPFTFSVSNILLE